jgi:GWxTD domain-containing protein
VPRREFMAEARFLLGDKEFEAFANLSLGEQERMLDEMWSEEDPSPETGVNEAYEEFVKRLEYVHQTFTEGSRKAIFTDRGQIYMKWGPPDEFVQDVIPVNRETISEAFAIVEDKYHPLNYSTHGIKPYTNSIRPPIVDHRRMSQVGEGGNTAFPFELWIYNSAGRPILKRHREFDPDIGMRYLFVDREGYGVYRLEASSKISDK